MERETNGRESLISRDAYKRLAGRKLAASPSAALAAEWGLFPTPEQQGQMKCGRVARRSFTAAPFELKFNLLD
jgi:hypothetical protein